MKNATSVRDEDGRSVQNLRVYCEGTNSAPEHGRPDRGPHEPEQLALFVHVVGEMRPDGLDHWELVDGHANVESKFLLPPASGKDRTHLDERRGSLARSSTDAGALVDLRTAGDVVEQLVFRCPVDGCAVSVLRDRAFLSGKFSQVAAQLSPGADGVVQLPVRFLN